MTSLEPAEMKIEEGINFILSHFEGPNPDAIIKCVTYFSINGDNTILDEKLEQLLFFDAITKY